MSTDPAAALHALIADDAFPCVGAKSAQSRRAIHTLRAHSLRQSSDDARITHALQRFGHAHGGHMFVSLAVLFACDDLHDETSFERALWARLQAIHDCDAPCFAWDERVSADPASPEFSMSVGGHAYYVIGLHPAASRPARRLPRPTLVFNLHRQFEQLRRDGRYAKMRRAILARDIAYAGSANPMLSEHGTRSEAAQYSGRRVTAHWRCPLHPHAPPHAAPEEPKDDS